MFIAGSRYYAVLVKSNRIKMHQLIQLVRHLRKIALFKVSTRTTILVLMAVGAWVASIQINFPETFSLGDKAIHAIVFFGFAVLMDLSSSRKPFWLWKGLPLVIYGFGIELMQYFIPFRDFSWLDLLANISGIMAYFIIKRIVIFYDNRR